MKNFEEGSDRCDLHTGTITQDATWRKDCRKRQKNLCLGPFEAPVARRRRKGGAETKDTENGAGEGVKKDPKALTLVNGNAIVNSHAIC